MKKSLLTAFSVIICAILAIQATYAIGDNTNALKSNLKVLTKGEAIQYPIADGTTIECYAKMIDGSIEAFSEYNEYFIIKNGALYSDTMNKLYKPEKKNPMKKIGNVKYDTNKKTIQIYDPLWEWSARHHKRVVKINTETGTYFMKGKQDNWRWYRNAIAIGYCRAI